MAGSSLVGLLLILSGAGPTRTAALVTLPVLLTALLALSGLLAASSVLGSLVLVLLLGGDLLGVVVVNHRDARQPTQKQGAGDQENAGVSQTVEERCYHVTALLPTTDGV